uniref:ADAMTS like 5 n=1 Tax=Astyanax mexicanus TaxID=7994 RepID=A0A8B9JPG5_ASTMX
MGVVVRFVINGNWKISIPGEYDVAGTKLLYRRSADTWESFEVPGPTQEDLHIMVSVHPVSSVAKVLGKVYVGVETRYDVQIIHTYRNRYHLEHREYLWAPNRCDCPLLEEGYQYVLMVRRHINYEQTLNRILLEEDSYAQPYRPREDSLLRPLEELCSNRGPRTRPRV